MKLRTKIWLGAGLLLAVIMAGDLGLGYRHIDRDLREQLDHEARIVKAILMATRRVYHQQFVASGLAVDEHTVGFLPAHALGLISAQFPEWYAGGLRFNNVSDRARNPDNRADAAEIAAMDWFRSNREAQEHIGEIRDAGGHAYYHFTSPLWVEAYCLGCHGQRQAAPPSIRARYAAAYEYQLGELRGVLSIKTPLDERRAAAAAHWFSRFGVRCGGYALLLLLLGAMLQRLVVAPLQHLQGAARRLGGGDMGARAQLQGTDEVADLARTFDSMAEAIADREAQIEHLNRIYAALSETNQTIVRVNDEAELLQRICRIAVDFGQLKLAWIGRHDAATQTIVVLESYGEGRTYLDGLCIDVDPHSDQALGPTATAWRNKQAVIVQDYFADATTAPWRERAREFGWGSSAAFPVMRGDSMHMVLNL